MTLTAAERAAAAQPANPPDFIRLAGLSKKYKEGDKERVVLRDAHAAFPKGEFAAIVGKSGTGKSTMLNLISGIDEADSGEVWVGEHNLLALDERQRTLFRRHNIGFVFQFFNLIPTLTVWENITLPLELDGSLTEGGRQRAASLLDEVGLGDRHNTFPDRLSGGEQQRVALARALVNDPLLLLADEPTGNLDERTGSIILDLMDRLTRQQGKNVIMVTHSMEAASYADRVLRLHDHQLEEEPHG
jgi:putative ABC transport system ATP-binding protein